MLHLLNHFDISPAVLFLRATVGEVPRCQNACTQNAKCQNAVSPAGLGRRDQTRFKEIRSFIVHKKYARTTRCDSEVCRTVLALCRSRHGSEVSRNESISERFGRRSGTIGPRFQR